MEATATSRAPVARRPLPAPQQPGEPRSERRRHREADLLRRYAETRDAALREELVVRFLPLARSLAARYRRRTEPFEDLVGVANLGLLKSVDGYDPLRGTSFTAYAVPTILGEIRRHFRDHVWNIRLPRGLQELSMKVDGATEELVVQLGRMPTAAQVAERLGSSSEEVLDAMAAAQARQTNSLDAPRYDRQGCSRPAVEALGAGDAGFDRVEAQLACEDAGLDEREREVLELRFECELTQRQIGDMLGVSQMQVSRISRGALWKLLVAVQGQAPDASPPPASRRRVAAAPV